MRDDDGETVVFDESGRQILPERYREREDDRAETEAERKTREFFEECNESEQKVGTLTLLKVLGGTNQMDHCERFPTDKFPDWDSVVFYTREKYGHGQYRVHGRVPGKKGISLNRLFSIAAAKDEKNMLPVPHNSNANDSLMLILQQMRNDQSMMMERLISAQENKGGGISAALEKLLKPETLVALAPVLPVLIKLFPRRSDPMEQIAKMLAITGDIKALREDDEKAANGATWPDMAMKALTQVGELVALKQPHPGQVAQQTPQKTIAPNPYAQAFKGHVDVLLTGAENDADTGELAAQVVASVPPQFAEKLYELLSSDAYLRHLASVNLRVLDYGPWFAELRDAVLDIMEAQPNDGANHSDAAPSDVPDNGENNGA